MINFDSKLVHAFSFLQPVHGSIVLWQTQALSPHLIHATVATAPNLTPTQKTTSTCPNISSTHINLSKSTSFALPSLYISIGINIGGHFLLQPMCSFSMSPTSEAIRPERSQVMSKVPPSLPFSFRVSRRHGGTARRVISPGEERESYGR